MGLVVDAKWRRVFLDGEKVILTRTEFEIVTLLSSGAGSVLSRDEILSKVWGRGYAGEYHMLQVNIARLRRKLPGVILTRSKKGYLVEGGDASGTSKK